MKILVTGAHGFLGRCLLELDTSVERVGCGRSDAPVAGRPCHRVDLGDGRAVRRLLARVRPDWVVHTAAITDVDRCEQGEEPRRVNLDVVRDLSAACAQSGAGLVHLSTDYVFDGRSGPYGEQDEPRPLSRYGQLKLESEGAVLEGVERGAVVRTLWLYGYVREAKANFATWALGALWRGEALRIFDDQWGNPTYIRDLARALVELCQRDARGLFHMGGATFLTRYEMVLELARFFGLDAARVEPVATREAGLKAARPLRTGLRTTALEEVLGRGTMSYVGGLEDMAGDPFFRRDFAHLF